MSERVTFKVPAALNEIFKAKYGKDIKDHLPSLAKYKDKITWLTDKIRIEADVAKCLFKDACDQASKHLASLYLKDEVKGIDTVLMVGGFSESPMLQKRIQESVPQDKKCTIPKDLGQAVLKGAVIFGHNPLIIEAR
ncbi:hypothetical protein DPMN_108556 [Dreissena polymorpha]|uniref:Uncharacterized protein n=1 Tax=Dreissena polymorpha TaxID=45954 RepID=A0A9D4K8S0_DREPO|nr:hypothetical protein DPMN_108556 [Dreissena polymorpha]